MQTIHWFCNVILAITLAGIAYLIKTEIYGFIGKPYIRTYAPDVVSFLEAAGRQLRPRDESSFQDMLE